MGLDVLRCKKQVQEEKGRDGKHMKNLRRLAGITVSLIVVFMVIALFRYQADEEMALLPDQIEYLFNEDWEVAVLEAAQTSGAGKPRKNKSAFCRCTKGWKKPEDRASLCGNERCV